MEHLKGRWFAGRGPVWELSSSYEQQGWHGNAAHVKTKSFFFFLQPLQQPTLQY